MDNKHTNSLLRISIFFLVFLFSSYIVHAQVEGQLTMVGATSVHYGDKELYELKDFSNTEGSVGSQYYDIEWYADSYIISEQNYDVTQIEIWWDSRGSNEVFALYYNYNDFYDQFYAGLTVSVDSTPSTPETPTVLSNDCNQVVLQRGEPYAPPYNQSDITWYWQSSSTGTSTANSASTITLTSGTEYYLRARVNAGNQQWSATSSSVQYSIHPETPTVGAITQPSTTSATGSVILSNLPADGSWIVNPGSYYGYGTTETITGLTPSTTYRFTVTNASGCTSSASVNVVINSAPISQPPVPTIGAIAQPTCINSKGSFTITNYNAAYTYTATPSIGVSFSGANVTVEDTNSSYNTMFTIKASSGAIQSDPSPYITINTATHIPATPTVGTITQPTETITGSVVLSNLSGNSIINPGNISNGYESTITITGLAPSVQPYNFTVTNSAGCTSAPSANVVINGYCGISDQNYVHTITPTIATTNVAALGNDQKIEEITYYDGIGRPLQKIGIRAGEVIDGITGTKILNDIISPVEYDEFERQTKEYLPYSDSFSCGVFRGTTLMNANVTSFYNTNKYENTINPYSEKEFEASPLSRVLKQGAPGTDWKLGNGHEIKLDYQTNATNEVKNFEVVFANDIYTPTLTLSSVNGGYYNANELYKTVTYDENTTANPTDETSGSTVEFKNKQGQVVLKRTYGTVGTGTTNEKYDTYYVYDDFGNLTYVLPPKMEATTAVITNINSQLSDLGYQYVYDSRNRLVEKKLPGKQWEFIVYDNLDRVVATGPAASPFSDLTTVGWLIIKYDAFNRAVLTGWYPASVTSSTRATLQNTQHGYTTNFNETKIATTSDTTVNGVTFRYTNMAWPTTAYHVLTVNYYDDYDYPNAPTIATTVEGEPVFYNTTVKPRGLPTGSWVRILQTSTTYGNELSYSFYDKKARPIRNYTTNFLGGYSYTDSKLDFTGKPEYSITYHKRDSGSTELKTKDAFTYSPQGRLLTQTHQIGTGTIETISSNAYDELGQLISKEVGGNTQKIDYAYNIRGWLKGINDVNVIGTDLFAFKISYNTPSAGISGVNGLYNGNISETQWATKSDNGIVRTYGYKYDNLNRLREGIYKKQSTVSNAYNESMTYDKNGNIMSLIRNGNDESIVTQIDNLTYSYGPSNLFNRLSKVVDNAPSASKANGFVDSASNTVDDYTYDANGNMLTDANKGISTNIIYNHLNLPTKITFGSARNIVYIYNAAGQKVQKVFTQGSTITTTDYLGGYQYKNSLLKFFPTAEGYVEAGSSYKYVYQYKDHLGNVRLSYDKTLAIQEENDYYPFGLKHTGYGYSQVVNSDYKYKYNGKELQDELGLNIYDYGARNYDPALGRWMNIDPLAETSRRFSPYTYALNNPVFFVDPDGMEATKPVKFDYNQPKVNYNNNSTPKFTDWEKNKETGEVKWFDGTGKQAENAATKHWGFLDGRGKTENLGSSFFGTKTNNELDNAQIHQQQYDYLSSAANKINQQAGVKQEGFGNNITLEYLSSKFLGTSFGNNSNKGSDLPGVIWDYGGGVKVEKYFVKGLVSAAAYNLFDAYLSSQDLGVGSDRTSHIRADAVNYFKTVTIDYITPTTLFNINLHKF
jgi:RHS repeat-associated protein